MEVLDMLSTHGAVLRDKHFVYKSGMHGPHYINMDVVLPQVDLMMLVCTALADEFAHIDTVVGAATGAIPLTTLTALSVGCNAVWADKVGDDFAFERAGFAEQLEGKQVLVVEDLLNTGDTVKKVVAQARQHGAEVVGVSVVCNRGSQTAESLDVPRLSALASVNFQAFEPDHCPQCIMRVPIVTDIGHGAQYQRQHPGYAPGYTTLLS